MKFLIAAVAAVVLLGIGFQDVEARSECPASWPLSAESEGFFVDEAGREWFVIVATDSNGYTTGRAYVADAQYQAGYAPSADFPSAVLRRQGEPVDRVNCILTRRDRPEPPVVRALRLYGSDPHRLDPAEHGWSDREYIWEIYGGLLTVGPDMTLQPDLAESWTVSDDGLVYTFHLNPRARFHHGRLVTADDVIYSFNRASSVGNYLDEAFLGNIQGASAKFSGSVETLAGLAALDDRTVRVELEEPAADFPARLTFPRMFVVDRHNVESGNDWFRNPNGTGPFKVASHTRGHRLVLDRHDQYHLDGPKVEKLSVNLCAECAPEELYANGAIDVWRIPWSRGDEFREHPDFRWGPEQWLTYYFLMNSDFPPFDDKNVRLALNYAIDREALPLHTWEAVPAGTVVPPSLAGYEVEGYAYDPERALALLAASKYGADLSEYPQIVLTRYGDKEPGRIFGAVLDDWRELGLPVSANSTGEDFASYRADFRNGELGLVNRNWSADFPEASTYLRDVFYGGSYYHPSSGGPAFDALVDQAEAEQDPAARRELYRQAEEMLLKEVANAIPIGRDADLFYLARPGVQGLPLTPMPISRYRHVVFAE